MFFKLQFSAVIFRVMLVTSYCYENEQRKDYMQNFIEMTELIIY